MNNKTNITITIETNITPTIINADEDRLQNLRSPVITKNQNLLDEMRNSDLVKVSEVRDEEGVYACNFTRTAFIDREWNDLTTKARGLFLDKNGDVVMRGFEKFFNIGENDETSMSEVMRKMTYPARVESKENGFLGLIGARPEEDQFRFYSKSGNTDYSDLISKEFYHEVTDPSDRHRLWEILRRHDVTMTVEVIDVDSDRHIIHYNESCLYFIHAIKNEIHFQIDYDADDEISEFFKRRPSYVIVNNPDELKRELDKAKRSTHEGCVVYGRDGCNSYMVKVKSDLYLASKWPRVPLRRVLVSGKPVPTNDSPRSYAVRWVLEHGDREKMTYERTSDGQVEPDMTYVTSLLVDHPEFLEEIERSREMA